jgi:hypothetical protein
MDGTDPDVIRGIERVTGETFNAETGQWTWDGKPGGGTLTVVAQIIGGPCLAGAGTITTMDDGYDRLEVLIRHGTTINGAVVALCPDEHGVVTADVCIDGPPVP